MTVILIHRPICKIYGNITPDIGTFMSYISVHCCMGINRTSKLTLPLNTVHFQSISAIKRITIKFCEGKMHLSQCCRTLIPAIKLWLLLLLLAKDPTSENHPLQYSARPALPLPHQITRPYSGLPAESCTLSTRHANKTQHTQHLLYNKLTWCYHLISHICLICPYTLIIYTNRLICIDKGELHWFSIKHAEEQ